MSLIMVLACAMVAGAMNALARGQYGWTLLWLLPILIQAFRVGVWHQKDFKTWRAGR